MNTQPNTARWGQAAAQPPRCLITGAAGFLGRELSRRFVTAGYRVFGVGRAGQPTASWAAHKPWCITTNIRTHPVESELRSNPIIGDGTTDLSPQSPEPRSRNARSAITRGASGVCGMLTVLLRIPTTPVNTHPP